MFRILMALLFEHYLTHFKIGRKIAIWLLSKIIQMALFDCILSFAIKLYLNESQFGKGFDRAGKMYLFTFIFEFAK